MNEGDDMHRRGTNLHVGMQCEEEKKAGVLGHAGVSLLIGLGQLCHGASLWAARRFGLKQAWPFIGLGPVCGAWPWAQRLGPEFRLGPTKMS